MNTYTAIDLFAGIGGIRLGFEQAFGSGLHTTFVSEWDKYAQATYRANFNTPSTKEANGELHTAIAGDITHIKEKDIPSFDICLAGFPCQAFSIAGKKQGFQDNYYGRCRGTLFLEVIRICQYHRPKVIFCENVKGLLTHRKGDTFKTIVGAFTQLGYKVFYKCLNSKDFGVPQNRERVYIVCFRNDIAPKNFFFPKGMNTQKCILDILEKVTPSSKYYLSTTYLAMLERHKQAQAAKGNGFGYIIRNTAGIAGTLVCGGMGRERNLIIDKRLKDFTPVTRIKGEVNREGIRKMTPREWARLQGFPDSFTLPLSDTQLYKQLGNTVTVPVIKAVAKEIQKVLEKNSV